MTDTDSITAARRASLMLMCLSGTGAAQAADPVTEALSNGETNLDARYRYELVDQEGVDKDAGASTLRTRLGYRTGEVSGFTGFLEAEHVTQLGGDTYNSTINGVDDRPKVVDPAETEINQAWVRYEGLSDTKMTYGRQRFFLDNHRFIGTVGWRQNEQTFDGFTVVNESLPDTTLTGGLPLQRQPHLFRCQPRWQRAHGYGRTQCAL
ncbi:MAG: alginate export family protein [Halospina sp.]